MITGRPARAPHQLVDAHPLAKLGATRAPVPRVRSLAVARRRAVGAELSSQAILARLDA